MKIHIPDVNKIMAKPEERFFKGYYTKEGKFKKKIIKTQATLPDDKKLLSKLGLKRHDRVLIIAGYYGNWAKALAKAGVMVHYSDVSQSLLKWCKKNLKEKNIKKYFCSDYVLIPSKRYEYDWTFSFEPIGAKQGLSIAMLRSLLNRRGGKLVVYPRIIEEDGSKHYKSSRKLTKIVKKLAKTYKLKYTVSKKMIKGLSQKGDALKKKHVIVTLFTNDFAREEANLDLKVLYSLKNKRETNLSYLSELFKISDKDLLESLNRIERLSKIIDEKFVKKVTIK